MVDDFEVLIQGDIEGLQRMDVPGFSKDGDDLCVCFDQGLDIRIILGEDPCPTGASKGDNLGLGKRDGFDLLKELEVLWIGSRPSSFDIMDTQLIQLLGNPDLILHREGNVLGLGTIPKGGIVDFNGI